MEIEIRDRNREVLYRTFTHTFGDAVEEAVQNGVSLKNADLRFSRTINGKDLSGGDFEGADFSYTEISNTNFNGANLSRARFSFRYRYDKHSGLSR